MAHAYQPPVWTWEGYLAWEALQPVRHELVDGAVRAMTGGTAAHDLIGNNLRSLLRTLLRGKPCRVQGPAALYDGLAVPPDNAGSINA